MKILPNENIIYKKRGSFKAFFDCYVYSRKYKEVSSAWLSWFMRVCMFFLVFAMWVIYNLNGKSNINSEFIIRLLLCAELNVLLLPQWIKMFKKMIRLNGVMATIVFMIFFGGIFIVFPIFITYMLIESLDLSLCMFVATTFVVLVMFYWLCKAKSSLIIITNKRMLIKTGIIFQDSTITDLRRVATIDIKQSVIGSIVGCGALVFHGYGIGGFCLPFMSSPIALRDEILKAQSGITDDGQKIDDDVLDEY